MTEPTLHASRKTKKTHLGEIPVDWAVRRIRDVGRVVTGSTPPTMDADNYGGSRLLVTPGDLGVSKYVTDSRTRLSDRGFAQTRKIPKGAVLFTCIGATIGKSGLAGTELATNQQINAVIPRDHADGEYLYYALTHIGDRVKQLAGTQAVPIVSKSQFEIVEIPLPPLPEQQRIAAVLGTWDRAIERQEYLLASKRQLKYGFMQQLLTGKKRFKGFTGQQWKTYRLSDLLERVFRPVTLSGDDPLDLISIRRRAGGLFFRGSFTAKEFKTVDLNRIEAGDFLVSKRQVTHGALAMVRQPFDGMHVSNEYVIFRCKAPEKLHMPFFDWLARSPRMWHMAYLASNGVHIEKLIFDARDFLREKIALPPSLEEQKEIVELLEGSDAEIRLLQEELKTLRDQKRGMMQKLLTGKLRVRA